MFLTWLGGFGFLWSLMFRDGFAGVVGSESADLIDDGGDNATTDSFFGRMLYVYKHLPTWLQDFSQLTFTKRRITCKARGSYVVGDARKGNIGRGGTYDTGLVDEHAYIEYSESSHASLTPACQKIIYPSTPNGRRNCFGRLRHDPESGFVVREFGWYLRPDRRVGLYRDAETGKLRSLWYDNATRGLSEERRGREFDLDFTTSLTGRVYKEFTYAAPPAGHVVPAAQLPYNPQLPLGICIDFGHARKTAGLFLQRIGPELLVVGEFTGRHRDARNNARDLAKAVRALGYAGDLGQIDFIPDPAAQYDETGSGHSLLWYYGREGFTNVLFPMLRGPRSVELGVALVRDKLVEREVLVSDACVGFIDDIQDYHYPTDPKTDLQRSDKPVHDMASHRMDAFRYGVTAYYTAVGDRSYDMPTPLEDLVSRSGANIERSMFDDDEDDLPPAIGQMVPVGRRRYLEGLD